MLDQTILENSVLLDVCRVLGLFRYDTASGKVPTFPVDASLFHLLRQRIEGAAGVG